MIEKDKEKEEEKYFIKNWKERIKIMEEDDKEEKEEIRTRAKNLKDYHNSQIENRKKKAEEEFKTDFENAIKTKLMLQNEQDEFLKYAEEWVNEYYQDGKNITPLLLNLKEYKKKTFSG
jgi:uncharacterized protein YchJ